MALFKCKMCGGSLEVTDGATIIECEYCGTQQTLPKTTDENVQSLFNRANLLRQKNEFDKAEAIYEKIIEADETEAEAYWGVILCKFGIEYVEDPKTYKRIPTCHRTSYDSIVADDYYKKALEYADMTQRSVYDMEAKQIDEIQKGILAIATNEEPYDVFICYKETDANGNRTQDSVIANDIYYQLKQEGFKVFYAAITLEDKLGSAYEPIIFAALNSSKVMLSIGTKPEYFNAVWVKNEWSRFLKMMKKDRSKMLIPCYKGIDAYELPEEFAHLQAQDMGKIGFINDIVRGIKKVIKKDEPKTTVVKETVVTNVNSNVTPLLKRAFMFLEDKEWESANEYAERVLDLDPENAEAYLVKLLIHMKKSSKKDLESYALPFDDLDVYKKIMRFADKELAEELTRYNANNRTRIEEKRKIDTYETAQNYAKEQTSQSQHVAAEKFKSIAGYRDSDARAMECLEKAKSLAEIERKDTIYQEALSLMREGTLQGFRDAIPKFQLIKDWKNSSQLAEECKKTIEEIKAENERIRINAEREAAQEAQRIKKGNITVITIMSAVLIFWVIFSSFIQPAIKYNNAEKCLANGSYAEALEIYKDLHYSKNYIIRIFNKEFGISPVQYINEKKMRCAMYLLETTSKSIVEIATECGYADYAYFYKQFVKKAGVSPSTYRKHIQQNPTEYR